MVTTLNFFIKILTEIFQVSINGQNEDGEANSVTIISPHTYHWGAFGLWGECSAECGGGIKSRKRLCYTDSEELVLNSHCAGLEDAETETDWCNIQPCDETGGGCFYNEWQDLSFSETPLFQLVRDDHIGRVQLIKLNIYVPFNPSKVLSRIHNFENVRAIGYGIGPLCQFKKKT